MIRRTKEAALRSNVGMIGYKRLLSLVGNYSHNERLPIRNGARIGSLLHGKLAYTHFEKWVNQKI